MCYQSYFRFFSTGTYWFPSTLNLNRRKKIAGSDIKVWKPRLFRTAGNEFSSNSRSMFVLLPLLSNFNNMASSSGNKTNMSSGKTENRETDFNEFYTEVKLTYCLASSFPMFCPLHDISNITWNNFRSKKSRREIQF